MMIDSRDILANYTIEYRIIYYFCYLELSREKISKVNFKDK